MKEEMYRALMCAGYSASFVLGVLTYLDAAFANVATRLIFVLYTVDCVGCCVGVTCMRSIPAKNVLYHHVPCLVNLLPVLYFQHTGRGDYYQDFPWIIAAMNVTSCNEAVWVGSTFLSQATLAGKPYRVAHACVTAARTTPARCGTTAMRWGLRMHA
jgi:hypothetical protein